MTPDTPEWPPAASGWLFAALIAFVLGVDYWLYASGRPTFSTALRGVRWPLFAPLCAALLGLLYGHVFFGEK